MNIRDIPDLHSFPPRDKVPAEILTDNLKMSRTRLQRPLHGVFSANFNTLGDSLGSCEKAVGIDQVVETWSRDMFHMGSSSRDIFFEALGRNYKTVSLAYLL